MNIVAAIETKNPTKASLRNAKRAREPKTPQPGRAVVASLILLRRWIVVCKLHLAGDPPRPSGLAPARACGFGEATRHFVAFILGLGGRLLGPGGDSWARAGHSSDPSGQPSFVTNFYGFEI